MLEEFGTLCHSIFEWQALGLSWPVDLQLKEAEANVTSLRDEALEREDVIGQNYGTIQLLRQQVGELEKSKFVMGFHAKVREQLLQNAASEIQLPCF